MVYAKYAMYQTTFPLVETFFFRLETAHGLWLVRYNPEHIPYPVLGMEENQEKIKILTLPYINEFSEKIEQVFKTETTMQQKVVRVKISS